MRRGSKHSPEYVAQQSVRMKAIYADPALRRKVSERTRLAQRPELTALRHWWAVAPVAVRKLFLEEALAPACLDVGRQRRRPPGATG